MSEKHRFILFLSAFIEGEHAVKCGLDAEAVRAEVTKKLKEVGLDSVTVSLIDLNESEKQAKALADGDEDTVVAFPCLGYTKNDE